MKKSFNTISKFFELTVHPACCILQQYISDQSIVAALPRLVLFLYAEGIISKMLLPTATEKLQSDLKESICADYHNLEKFAVILQQLLSTEAIGTVIRKDYGKQVQCI